MDVQFDAILIDNTALSDISIPPDNVLAYIVLPIHLASLVVLPFRNSFPDFPLFAGFCSLCVLPLLTAFLNIYSAPIVCQSSLVTKFTKMRNTSSVLVDSEASGEDGFVKA